MNFTVFVVATPHRMIDQNENNDVYNGCDSSILQFFSSVPKSEANKCTKTFKI